MSTGNASTRGSDVFGTVAVAMVTPFDSEGNIDLAAGVNLAGHLVDQGCDALVLAGTTGESPTTSTQEKLDLLKAVRAQLGNSVKLIAGSGTNNTASTIALSQQSQQAGADALLVVTPYYSRPSQDGIFAHFTAVADAVDIPISLYDIPSRSSIALSSELIARLSAHENIQAVKDAKGDLAEAMLLMEQTGLAWYSGDDPLNLAWLASGATGCVSVIGHVAASQLRALRTAYDQGDMAHARAIAVGLNPLYKIQSELGGVGFAKAALELQGIPVGVPRLPINEPSETEKAALALALKNSGV